MKWSRALFSTHICTTLSNTRDAASICGEYELASWSSSIACERVASKTAPLNWTAQIWECFTLSVLISGYCSVYHPHILWLSYAVWSTNWTMTICLLTHNYGMSGSNDSHRKQQWCHPVIAWLPPTETAIRPHLTDLILCFMDDLNISKRN